MPSYSVVGASATPLFTDKPNLIRSAVLRATINDWPKTETILDTLASGYNIDYRRSYSYANNDYYRGHLQANNTKETVDWSIVQQWLADYWGVTFNDVVMSYTEYDSLSGTGDRTRNFDISRDFDIYGITTDPATGYLTGFLGVPDGYVSEINEIVQNRSEGDEYDPSELTWEIYYTYFDPADKENTSVSDNRYIVYSYMNERGGDCIQVTYTIPGSVTLYLCYDPLDDYFPELSETFLGSIESLYFPVALLRIGSMDTDTEWIGERSRLSSTENQEQYDDTSRLLKYWGLELEDLKEQLATNPDIDDITRAFVTLAIPISDLQDVDTDAAQYLYKYWEYLIETYDPPNRQEWLDNNPRVLYSKTKSIRFYEEVPSTLRMLLSWSYIQKESIPYDSSKPTYYFDKDINYTEDYASSNFPGNNFVGEPSKILVEFHNSDTGVAFRIVVCNLTSTLVDNVLDRNNTPLFTLRQAFPTSGEDTITGIIFPMALNVLEGMSKADATSAALSGITLITQTFLQIKLKWYERQDFWSAVKIIIFVVSVVYMSPQISAAAQQGISELITYVLESIVIGAVISEAVGYVTTFLAGIIGGEATLILAIIAAAVSAYYGYTGQTFAYLPTAEDMLKIVTMMAEKINEITQEEYVELEEEYSEFLTEYNEAMEQLEDAQDGLLDVGIDPAWIARNTGFLPGETPTTFYARTVGTANPGIYSLDAVTHFYADQLTLPSVGSSGLTL